MEIDGVEYKLIPGLMDYYVSNHKRNTKRVNRIVALTWLPNPNNLPQVHHIDENKLNNKTSNLEWCTSHYNKNYGTRNQKCMITRGTPVKCIETR